MLRKLKRKYWYPISVDLERSLNKLIRWANRVWLRIWPIFFIVPVTLMLIGAFLQVKHDYSLIHNYINLDAFNEGIYINWRTDGSPGQEPPK
jgi:hypothetical protein